MASRAIKTLRKKLIQGKIKGTIPELDIRGIKVSKYRKIGNRAEKAINREFQRSGDKSHIGMPGWRPGRIEAAYGTKTFMQVWVHEVYHGK